MLENTYFKCLLWLRYLDNSFCIWTEGFERLKDFYQYLDSFHPTIKFTMEFSKEQINFLDVNITEKGTLQADLYCKSTDTHQFLHFKCYPRYVYKKPIPYGQAIRKKRISSNKAKNHLAYLRVYSTGFVVGVIRKKWFIAPSSCISQSKNTERSFSKIKVKNAWLWQWGSYKLKL